MHRSLEFLLGLLDDSCPAHAAWEDLDGPHGRLLRTFQEMGFLDSEPGMNPVPSCPDCFAGTPYLLDDHYVCNRCHTEVDRRFLQLWRFDLGAFLRWVADEQRLQGGVEQIDDGLWRLGTLRAGPTNFECFFQRGQRRSELGRKRLSAFRDVLLLHGSPNPPTIDGLLGRIVALAGLLETEGEILTTRPLAVLLQPGGAVGFDAKTGDLRAGDVSLGRVPPGLREYHLVAALWDYAGELVPYADLKRYVCAKAGSHDGTDEATFCQKLKSRLKHVHGIREIDRLIETDRLGGGYRMKAELSLEAGVGAA